MKVEFLEHGSADCPLLRIYGDEPDVCQHLRRAFENLALGSVEEVSITDLQGVEPLDGCCLVAKAGSRDRGIVRTGESRFLWVLTPATWDNVAFLIEPFCGKQTGGYQWLDQVPASEARVLVSTSPSGCW